MNIAAILVAIVTLITVAFGQEPVDRIGGFIQRLCPEATVYIEAAGGLVDAIAQAEVEVVPTQIWQGAQQVCDHFAPAP